MTTKGKERHVRRQAVAPLLLGAMTVVGAVVAGLLGQAVWAAALGAGLCLGYWALEALAWRRGAAVPFGAALGVALGAMVLRFALVLGVLILVGVFARPDFATAALAFLASFSVYVGVRLFTYPPAGGAAREADAR
ncbi:MAG: hypothetical protein WCP98_11660 [Actinomycetes bacterium]